MWLKPRHTEAVLVARGGLKSYKQRFPSSHLVPPCECVPVMDGVSWDKLQIPEQDKALPEWTHSHAVTWHVGAARYMGRFRSNALVNVQNGGNVFSWDLHTQQILEFAGNGAKNKKHPVRGERKDWLETDRNATVTQIQPWWADELEEQKTRSGSSPIRQERESEAIPGTRSLKPGDIWAQTHHLWGGKSETFSAVKHSRFSEEMFSYS